MSFIYTHKLPTSTDSIATSTRTLAQSKVVPRKGGPKETRMSRVKLMDTGRYCEAAIARGEAIEDVEIMHTLRINNVFDATEEDIRSEFEVYGKLGDVYRPINKDKMSPLPFFFVRFMDRSDMLNAMEGLNGKVLCGRKMIIEEAKSAYDLDTSVY